MSASANAAPGYLKGILPNISGNLWMADQFYILVRNGSKQPIAQLCKLSNASIGEVLQNDTNHASECYYWREKVFFEGVRVRFVNYAGNCFVPLSKKQGW